jgi:putative ABC transport system permease protein
LGDEHYLENMEVDLVAGTYFKPEAGLSNKNFVVINEEAVEALQYSSALDAIGEDLIYQADSSSKTIIGVVKNYNHQFLFDQILPMALLYNPEEFNLLQVKHTGTYEDAASAIEKAWSTVNPQLKVDYNELEAEIKQLYQIFFGDLVQMLAVISLLAIMISCLGLLGMTSYTMGTKRKEISIRKVLGSTDTALVLLLSRGFFQLTGMAIMIGVPLAWFINNLWLQLIAYRTELTTGVICSGIGILLKLAMGTIFSQTIRATSLNPVDNLKCE